MKELASKVSNVNDKIASVYTVIETYEDNKKHMVDKPHQDKDDFTRKDQSQVSRDHLPSLVHRIETRPNERKKIPLTTAMSNGASPQKSQAPAKQTALILIGESDYRLTN